MTTEAREVIRFEVRHEEGGVRLDRLLAGRLSGRSRAFVQRLIAGGHVQVEHWGSGSARRLEASAQLPPGSRVRVEVPPPEPTELTPWTVDLPILLAEPEFLVIDKPAGWVVHPGAGHREGTLVNALIVHYPEVLEAGSSDRPGIVHRLDRGTSGVMVVARTAAAYQDLVRQFSRHQVDKCYLAIVQGRPDPPQGTIERAIGRDVRDRKKFSVRSRRGRPAVTHYRVRESGSRHSLVEVRIETGRTHQIRVHLTSLGHALVGDPTYGRTDRKLPEPLRPLVSQRGGAFLHALRLGFRRPGSDERIEIEAPVPDDFRRVWEALRDE